MRRAVVLLVFCVALAVLHTWPLASNLGGLSRMDNADSALNVWIITWVAHGVVASPFSLFDAPIFHPERYTLAYSEHLIVPSLMGAPLVWVGLSPVVVYNLLAIAGYALSAWAMTLLIAAWTGSLAGGIVAGMLFAFNAHLLTRFVHLQALHVEFLPLVLFAFDRVVRGGGRRDAALLAGAFVLQSLCSNHTMVFLAAALLAALIVRAREWTAPDRRARKDLAGAAVISLAALLPFLWPYYLVSRDQGLIRPLDEVAHYSAHWLDYLTTAGRLHYAWWSHRFFEGRTSLFPGVVALALAAVGLASRARWRDGRVRMMVMIAVIGLALSFGPALPGYAWLHTYVPPLQGLRNAARWGFLTLLAIAVLAGYGVAAIERRMAARWRTAIAIVLACLVTIEALRAPMSFTPFAGFPAIYRELADDSGAVVAEYPLYYGNRLPGNGAALIGNTQYLRPMLNGYSGFEPASFLRRAQRLRSFPAADAVTELRGLGVNRIVVRLDEFVRSEGQERLRVIEASPELTLMAEAEGIRLYRMR